MPKVQDIKAYWKEIAAKAGLQGDDLQKVSSVLDNDQFAKAFSDNFKPLPDYSHDLDDVRTKAEQKKDDAYKEWYDKEQAKYQEYVQGIEELQRYRQQLGTSGNFNGGPKSMTQEEIDKLVDAKLATVLTDTLSRRDNAVLDLLDVRESHMGTFKKPLDTKAFEAAWKEHPEWGGSLKTAYKSFIEPDVEKIKEAESKAREDARYQDGVRDGFSRRSMPVDRGDKTFSPFFDRKEDVSKMSESEQERHSREAFFQGWNSDNKSA
jgi:hypothetical protein